MNNEKTQQQIDMIIRQTDYNQETAEQKLLEFNNDVMAVIRDYMKPVESISTPPINIKKKSKNQQIFKEIRDMMDNASRIYEDKKSQLKAEEEQVNITQQTSHILNVIQEEEAEAEAEANADADAEANADADAEAEDNSTINK